MVHSVGKGLLDVFKRIQEDRSIVEKDDRKPVISLNEDSDDPEQAVARANVITANKLSAVTTVKDFDEAVSLLGKVRHEMMHPQVVSNLENYYNFDRRSIGDSLLD